MVQPVMLSLPVLLWLAGAPSGDSPAGPSVRVAVVFTDGDLVASRSARAFERMLASELQQAKNVVLVNEAQLRDLRQAAERAPLRAAAGSQVITSADADLVIAGELDLRKKPDRYQMGLTAYTAAASVSLFTTDTGDLVKSADELAGSKGALNAIVAEKAALKRLAGQVASVLAPHLERPASQLTRVEVEVLSDQALSAKDERRTLDRLRALDGVEQVHVVRRQEKRMQLDLSVRRRPPEQLARQVSEDGEQNLTVVAYSAQTLKLRLNTEAATIELEAPAFTGPRGASALTRDAVLGPVDALGFIKVRDRPRKSPPRALVLTGRVRKVRGATSLRVKVVDRTRKRPLLTRRRVCPKGELLACGHRLGTDVAQALSKLRTSGALAVSAPTSEVVAVTPPPLTELFAASFSQYLEHPLTQVTLTNKSPVAAKASVTATLEGVSAAPRTVKTVEVGPGQQVELPVWVDLDREKMALSKSRLAPLKVTVQVEQPEQTFRRRVVKSVLIHDQNAMRWSVDGGRMVGGFIDGRSPAAERIAAAAQRVAGDRGDDPVSLPVALVEALRGMQYISDGQHPLRPGKIDIVRYPEQTIQRGGGDCDDLTVLLAAATEAAGRRALVIRTPGHVLLGVSTGLRDDQWGQVAIDPSDLVVFEDELFIPVETTKMQGGFMAAWHAAADLLRAEGTATSPAISMFKVVDAWASYPPAGFAPDGATPLDELVKSTAAGFGVSLRRVVDKRQQETQRLLSMKADGSVATRNQRGIVLAQRGFRTEARALFEAPEMLARPESLNNLGALLLVDGAPEPALKRLRSARDLDTDNVRIRLNLVLAAFAAGNDEMADDILASIDAPTLKQFSRRWRQSELPGRAQVPDPVRVKLEDRLRTRGVLAKLSDGTVAGQSQVSWNSLVHWLP